MNTAKGLLERVRAFGPALEGTELVFATDPPPELDVVLCVLHTGVRALLAGKTWWGTTSPKVRVLELNPADPLPAGVALLAVEGDGRWDRLRPDAHLDLPKLFTPDTSPAR